METENVKFPLLKYNFMQQTRFFKTQNNLVISYYYVKKEKQKKRFVPYDRNGYRFRLNLKTGELNTYSRSEVQNSISSSVRRSKILLNMLLNENEFDWFLTFTFDPRRVKRKDPKETYKAYCKFIDNMIYQYPKMTYVTVPENHENSTYEDRFIHFHMLVGKMTPEQLGFENSGKVVCHWATNSNEIASREYFEKTKHLHELKETDGLTVYNVTKFHYGFTTATKIANHAACNHYVKKYIDKSFGTTDIFKKRFFFSRNLKMPEISKELVKETMFVSDLQFDTDLKEGILHKNNPDKVKKYLNKNFNTVQYHIDKKFYEESIENLKKGLIPVESVADLPLEFKEEQTKIKI